MRFVEDYWQDFIDFGFIKTETNGRIDYTLPKEIGSGGFSILGDPKGAMGIISNCSLKKPFVIVECVHEKMIEIGQYYEGSVTSAALHSQIHFRRKNAHRCIRLTTYPPITATPYDKRGRLTPASPVSSEARIKGSPSMRLNLSVFPFRALTNQTVPRT